MENSDKMYLKDYTRFYTPDHIAQHLVASAPIHAGSTILEPSAGSGNIVRAIRGTWRNTVYIVAVEVQIRAAEEFIGVPDVSIIGDFLAVPLAPIFDVVIANPPFNETTHDHVAKMLRILRKGGKLIAILPVGFIGEHLIHARLVQPVYFIDNWATNKDGSITPIEIVQIEKGPF